MKKIVFLLLLIACYGCTGMAKHSENYQYIPGGPIEQELELAAQKFLGFELLYSCDFHYVRDIEETDIDWILHTTCVKRNIPTYVSSRGSRDDYVSRDVDFILRYNKAYGDVTFGDRITPIL